MGGQWNKSGAVDCLQLQLLKRTGPCHTTGSPDCYPF